MPFTELQFFDVFQRYNDAVWPAQFFLYAIAIIAVVLTSRGGFTNSRYVAGILAVLWAWVALVYHVGFFRTINPAALLFAALFLVQSGLFVWYGAIRPDRTVATRPHAGRTIGAALIVYALFFYPLIAVLSGQHYPAMPTFGLPCPTTIFTIGLLMWRPRSTPLILFAIPVLWGLIATQVAIQFGVYEDFGLTLAAFAAVVFSIAEQRARRRFHSAGAA